MTRLSYCGKRLSDYYASDPMFELAIIIPHYNDLDRLLRCLEALMPQLDPQVELVVVDNASTVDLAPLHAAWPGLRVLSEPRKGAAEARNRGVAETTAEMLLFIDSDCIPAADWLATARRLSKGCDLIGGEVSVFDETPAPRSGAEAFETVFAFNFRRYIEEENFSGSGNLLTRRDVFEKTGPFRTGVSEDMDWCHRAIAQGFSLRYEETLQVSHPSRQDWAALRRKWKRVTEEQFGVNGNTPAARLKWALRAALMPASILAHIAKVLRHPSLRDGGERWRALQTLAHLRLQRMLWMLAQAATGRP